MQSHLNYIKLKDLLIRVGFISEVASLADSKDRSMLYDLWKMLKGEMHDEVAIADIRVVLFALARLYDHPRIGIENSSGAASTTEEGISDDEKESKEDIGFFNNRKQFCLRNQDIPVLHKAFELLYLNRMQFVSKKKVKVEENFSFKPKISKNTESIANKYRSKIAEQINEQKISTYEWLSVANNREEWRHNAKQLLDEEKMKHCTF